MLTLAALVATLLGALSAIHVYWATGGQWGGRAAVPEVGGVAAITPGPLACLTVAALLATAALLVAAQGGLLRLPVPPLLIRIGTAGVGLVFTLRTIGDLRLFGLFRRVTGTTFARYDALLYTPLCLLLAAACFALVLRSPARP